MSVSEAALLRTGRSVGVQALVFVALGAFIAAIYALIVVTVGALVGGSALVLSIVATAVVAIAFEPVRTKLQRWAARVAFGKRATPYEVLAETTGKLTTAESVDGLLERMASMLRAGVGAERAAVWLAKGPGFTIAAAMPSGDQVAAVDAAALPGAVELIQHDGEVLGALTIETSRGHMLTPTELVLVSDLAGSAALVMRQLRLDAALEAKAAELQESRRRLVDAQDTERRRLERDLHDGAQQLVVALKVKLGLARRLAEREGSERAATLIDETANDTQLAIDQIRTLARGIYPPLLQSDGLAAAVPSLAALSLLDVRVDVDVTRRHRLQLEGAVYFCISEALTNAAKHGRGPVHVAVSDTAVALSFEVTDSGPGFDVAGAATGAGLRNMADRIDTLGGTFTLTSTPGGCTTVSGTLPLVAVAAAGS